MKKLLLLLVVLFVFLQAPRAQPFVYIPDSNLRVILSQLDSLLIVGDSMDLSNPAITSTTSLPLYMSPVVNTTGIEYFVNVDSILAQSSSIRQMPSYPPNLEILYICCSNLDTLYGPFPSTLRKLDVSFNHRVTTLPPLPPGMQFLDIQRDSISVLPPLPSTLTVLDAGQNELTSLPPLPPGLVSLYLGRNFIDSLPSLPATLQRLFVEYNPLSCLPLLPAGLQHLGLSGTGISCLPNFPPAINSSLPQCNSFTSLCLAYPQILGSTYVDGNGNGQPDSAEGPLRNEPLMVLPDSMWISSDGSGDFLAFVDIGGPYTIQPFDPVYYSVTTTPLPTAQFTAYSQIDSLNDIGYFPLVQVSDLSVSMTMISRPRPGFIHRIKLYYTSEGTLPVTNGVLSFLHDSRDSLLSASDSSYTVNGDTIQWLIPLLQPGDLGEITLVLKTSTAALNGDTLCFDARIEPLTGDSTPSTNLYSLCDRVVNSIDPNDKSVYPFDGLTLAQAQAGAYLDYTVRFQNTGTADAVNIEIQDTLSPLLDLASFEMLDGSHPSTWSLHASSRLLRVKYLGIHLPDSTTNEPLSHGYFHYRVRTLGGVTAGSQILNTAAIYFDFNAPVMTNTTVTEIYVPVAVGEPGKRPFFSILPNPARTHVTVNCPGVLQAEVMSLSGKVLQQAIPARKGTLVLDVQNLPSGMYFIRLKTNDGFLTGKFIKE